MKSIKQFLDWVKTHPFKAVGFTCIFSVLSTALALSDAFVQPGLAVYGLMLSMFVLVLWLDTRKTIAILLAACLLFTSAPPAQSHTQQTQHTDGCGPIIVGIIVVVVGGVVIYKVVKFCQKKFAPTPANTNAPPDNEFTFSATATATASSTDDDSAASYSASASDIYCWEEQWPADSDPEPDDTCDQSDPPPAAMLVGAMPYTPFFISEPQPTPPDLNAFEIYGNLSGIHMRPMEKTNDAPALLDTADFYRVLATHGISYYDGGGGVAFYGRAGQPCSPEQCPIQFIQIPGKRLPDVVISNGRPTHQLLIQRSVDLSNWVTMFRSAVPEGMTVRCEDISRRTKGFYRIVSE